MIPELIQLKDFFVQKDISMFTIYWSNEKKIVHSYNSEMRKGYFEDNKPLRMGK